MERMKFSVLMHTTIESDPGSPSVGMRSHCSLVDDSNVCNSTFNDAFLLERTHHDRSLRRAKKLALAFGEMSPISKIGSWNMGDTINSPRNFEEEEDESTLVAKFEVLKISNISEEDSTLREKPCFHAEKDKSAFEDAIENLRNLFVDHERSQQSAHSSQDTVYKTRYGRTVRPPNRLGMACDKLKTPKVHQVKSSLFVTRSGRCSKMPDRLHF